MTNNTNIIKPLSVAREEFVENFINMCNESGLPFFMIEDILKSLAPEIHSAAVQQTENEKKQYQAQLGKQTEETA